MYGGFGGAAVRPMTGQMQLNPLQQRPGTRGGALGALPSRQNAAIGAMAGGFVPPGTAARLPTAYRPPTSVFNMGASMRPATGTRGLRTGMGTAAGFGGAVGPVGLQTDVQIAERPVTQAGVGGTRTSTSQGPGRQVMDKSYFAGILRAKVSEMQQEIARMVKEGERIEADAAAHDQLMRKKQETEHEVSTLRAQLADLNATLENVRLRKTIADIDAETRQMEHDHGELKVRLDQVFTERASRDALAREVNQQMEELKQQAEQQISDLDQETRVEYFNLQEEHAALQQQAKEMTVVLENVDREVTSLEMQLNSDPLRLRVVTMMDTARQLRAQVGEMERAMAAASGAAPQGSDTHGDASAASAAPTDERAALLARVREDNAAIVRMEKDARELETAVASQREELDQINLSLRQLKGEGERGAKVAELMEKDREMSEFIERFDSVRAQKRSELAAAQQVVLALLTHISENVRREETMPSTEQVQELNSAAAHKKQQLHLAEHTADKLQIELRQRQQELERIDTLDEKMSKETAELRTQLQRMRTELPKFKDVTALQDRSDQLRRRLLISKQALLRRKDALKVLNGSLAAKLEKAKQRLADSEVATELNGFEQKLQQYAQAVFQLQEYIAEKSHEGNIEPHRAECLRVLAEINQLHVQHAAQAAQ